MNLLGILVGVDDDLHTTSTVIIMERLQPGDKVYIEMEIDADHGDSKIQSEITKPAIHFIGHKIAD